MKTCPRCKNRVSDEDHFCPKCGWDFYRKNRQSYQNNQPYRRRYEQQKFENADFSDVQQWLAANDGNIEIKNITGNLRFACTGIIFKKETWYFQYLTINYYPNTPGHSYGFVADANTDIMFSSGSRTSRNADRMANNNRVIFECMRSGYVPGHHGGQTHCKTIIFERV